jgi:RNA polymerase sigma-70 factor (ECF subfamily)
MAQSSFEIEIDEVTLAAARRGDLRACEAIYRQFERPAFTAAVRVLKCRQLAQDATQEAFITAFRRIRQFRGDSPFWGWLRMVVVNHAISMLRRQPSAEVVSFEDWRGAEDGDQERIGQAMDLEEALAQLSDEDRTIVWMHDVEGYKHHEIAGLFGMTESFSKTRLARARQRLREYLEARNENPGVANALAWE